ncbi:MAG: GNAT family N-acetyltransferase [Aestuariibacter sp.]
MNIETVDKNNYQELIEVWESSVRATHDFLPEEKIIEFKPLILKHYFDAVDLRCCKNSNGKITGFVGVAEGNIEMLFVDANYFGQAIGRQLTEYAITHMAATKVDVNEQNPGAIGFYERLGFVAIGRSELDGQGNPFPLIHMQLQR